MTDLIKLALPIKRRGQMKNSFNADLALLFKAAVCGINGQDAP